MKKETKHTFVILAYNKSKYIDACIQSLNAQTVKSNILISTSTPSDFLEQLGEKYKIPIKINPIRNGIATDWSFAYNISQSKYLTLAHQDDLYLPEYVEQCVQSAENSRQNLITFTNYLELYDDRLHNNSLVLRIKRMILLPFFINRIHLANPFLKKLLLSFGNPVCCPTIMYNRQKIGKFIFNNDFQMNLDWEAALRLASVKGAFTYNRNKLLIRRLHSESESTISLENNNRLQEDLKVFNSVWPHSIARILMKIYVKCYQYY